MGACQRTKKSQVDLWVREDSVDYPKSVVSEEGFIFWQNQDDGIFCALVHKLFEPCQNSLSFIFLSEFNILFIGFFQSILGEDWTIVGWTIVLDESLEVIVMLTGDGAHLIFDWPFIVERIEIYAYLRELSFFRVECFNPTFLHI